MQKYYICPECKGHLKVGEYIIFTVSNENADSGLLLLHPNIGNYDSIKHPTLNFNKGEVLDFHCPMCSNSMISQFDKNLVHVIMVDKDKKEYDIYFSRIAGEKTGKGRHSLPALRFVALLAIGDAVDADRLAKSRIFSRSRLWVELLNTLISSHGLDHIPVGFLDTGDCQANIRPTLPVGCISNDLVEHHECPLRITEHGTKETAPLLICQGSMREPRLPFQHFIKREGNCEMVDHVLILNERLAVLPMLLEDLRQGRVSSLDSTLVDLVVVVRELRRAVAPIVAVVAGRALRETVRLVSG